MTGQFSNQGMTGFAFEELGLLATDPDEGEILYAVGEARGEGEAISGSSEKLDEFIFAMDLVFDGAANVQVNISHSLIYATQEDLAGKADLIDGKVPSVQLPEMDYDPAGSAAAVQANLTAHTNNQNNPHGVTAAQVGAAAASHAHGNVTSAGAIGTAANKAVYTGTSGVLQAGTLPVAAGGTGLTSAPSLLVNLASASAAGILSASPRPGVTGTLPVARGGTGQTSLAGLASQLQGQGLSKVAVGTYTGNAPNPSNNQDDKSAHTQTISLPFTPKAVLVMTRKGQIHYDNGHEYFYGGLAVTGQPAQYIYSSSTFYIVRISGNGFVVNTQIVSLSNWSTIVRSNDENTVYHYIAIG